MATVTVIFTDEPNGDVNVKIEFDPEVKGDETLSPAQGLALMSLQRAKQMGGDDDE